MADPNAADALASEPRPDDQRDRFAFDPTGIIFDPTDPAYDTAALPRFTLTKPPYSGPRRVRLLTDAGDRIPLQESEVLWDEIETRNFTLALIPTRELTDITGVEVLYGVIAVFIMLKLHQTISVVLESADANQLEQSEALVAGVIELHRQELLDNSTATFNDGEYAATVTANSLKLIEGNSPTDEQRQLIYQVEIELKSTRALRDDEGRPIVHIRTPGRPLDPARPVDIAIGVDA